MRNMLGVILIATALLSAPAIKFEETEYDFGTVERGEKVTHYFKFKNTGDEPLVIEKVRSSCGCTAALATKKVLQPGEEGKIRVEFNSRGYNGKVTKSVTVKSNDPTYPTVRLIITGKVESTYSVNPGYLALGLIRPDSLPVETVTVTFKKKGMGVDSIKVASGEEYIKVKPLEEKKDHYTFEVRLKPNVKEGNLFGRIDLYLKNSKDPLVRIPLSAKIMGDIEVFPTTISFGGPRGRTKHYTISVEMGSKVEDVFIDSLVVSDIEGVSVAVDSIYAQGRKKVADILIEIKKDAEVGMKQGDGQLYLRIKKSDGSILDKKIKIGFVGFIR